MISSDTVFYAISEEGGLDEFTTYAQSGGDLAAFHEIIGLTLIQCACEHMNLPLIRTMAKSGVDINGRGKNGYPPIFQAADIDIDAVQQAGLHWGKARFEVLRCVLECGADPEMTDNRGRSLNEFISERGSGYLELLHDWIDKPTPERCSVP